jgi:hypothetical protein
LLVKKLNDDLQVHMFIRACFVKVLFPVFISYSNEESRRVFIYSVSVTLKVSKVLSEFTARIEMEKGERECRGFVYWKCNKLKCIKVTAWRSVLSSCI